MPVNGRRLHYYTAGDPDAPPVILLHGGGIDSAKIAWRLLIDPLAETYYVFALDLPGYGKSDPPPREPYTTPFLLRTLRDFIETLRFTSVTLVGLSMGGALALGYAVHRPLRVAQLVLVDTYGIQDTAPFHPFARLALRAPVLAQDAVWELTRANRMILWAGLSRIFFNPLAVDPLLLQDAAESIRLELFYEWLNTEITDDGCLTNYTPRLPELNMPTLLVHGRFDPSIPVGWARRAAGMLPYGELVEIPFCGHWPNRERPHRFNRAVLEFLND